MTNDIQKNSKSAPSIKVRPAWYDRLFWLCTAVGVIALVAVLALFGWSLWTAILIALLLACPAIVTWGVITQRYPRVTISRNAR